MFFFTYTEKKNLYYEKLEINLLKIKEKFFSIKKKSQIILVYIFNQNIFIIR